MTIASSPLPEWDLSDLYSGLSCPRFTADKTRLAADAKSFTARWKGTLASASPEQLAEAIGSYETLQDLIGRMLSYADLLYAGDTTDPTRAKFFGDTQQFITDVATGLIFFELELNRLDDAALDNSMTACDALNHYAPWLRDLRREKPHQLPDELERLFLEKAVCGRTAWNRLFDETLTSLTFQIDGETLGLEPTLNRLQSSDETERHTAFQALSKTFRDNLRVFTLVTNTLAKDKAISNSWRAFADMADSRHLANRVEGPVVEALVQAVRAAYPRLSHRYYALKAKWFGKDKLNAWDRNAPLPQVEMPRYAWPQARETVLDAFSHFSPAMAKIADSFFQNGWIDAPARMGKAPGAFAHPTVPSAHPYILLNYMEKPRDVMTLAHELGHGVHQVLAAPQGALMAPTPLTLAETASVFGEMLTFRRLLATARSTAERKALLASKVEDMINTVVRQIAFYTFERSVHAKRSEGELTAEDICALWMTAQSESLGPAVQVDTDYEPFWVYISHFIHSPFYVYAYAFGDCLVNSLYALYEKAHPQFVDHYFALLRAGGSKPYGELLAPFGLDARDPHFWNLGLRVLDSMITELEGME